MCSHHTDVVKVSRALRLAGFPVRAERASGYLGVDSSCGGRHTRAIRRKRSAKHNAMNAKVRRFAIAGRKYTVAS
eukprot:4664305-Pyramimonas_sp.AAC.1